MTTTWRWLAVLLLAGVLVATVAVLPTAADDKKETKKADKGEDEDAPDLVIELSTTAYKTADFGREHKSPEALVAAAVMLRSLKTAKMEPITEQPTDEKGKPIAEKALKVSSFADQADDLFDEASALALQLKLDRFDAYIASAKSRDTRAVVGGAKTIKRRIEPGQWHVYHFRFEAEKKASFGLCATESLKFQVVRDDIQNVWGDIVTKHHTFSGHPGGKRGQQAPFGISINNPHRKAAEYTLSLR